MRSRHLFSLAFPGLLVANAQPPRVERAVPNDNRTASGVMRDGRLENRTIDGGCVLATFKVVQARANCRCATPGLAAPTPRTRRSQPSLFALPDR